MAVLRSTQSVVPRRRWAVLLAAVVALAGPLSGAVPAHAAATFNVSLALAPACIHVKDAAHPTPTSTATATVTDMNGAPVPFAAVLFQTTGDVTFSSQTSLTGPDGKASVTVNGSTTADDETITASYGGASGSKVLTEFSDIGKVSLTVDPTSIPAVGGTSTATASVFTDAQGTTKGVACPTNVLFDNGGGDVTFDPVTDHNANGDYSTIIHSSNKPDKGETINVTAGGHLASAELIEYGSAAKVAVTLSKNPITADGRDTTVANATVTDALNNRVLNESVLFEHVGQGDDVTFGTPNPVTTNNNGVYTDVITASNTPNTTTPEKITATATVVSPHVTSPAVDLVENPAPIGLTLNPTSIKANSSDTSTATATVTGADGQGVAGEPVTFTRSGDQNFSQSSTTGNDGKATATIPALAQAQTETITAKDTRSGATATAMLTEFGTPASISLTLGASSIPATGGHTTATATVMDNSNPPQPVPNVNVGFSGQDVTFSSSNVPTGSDGKATTTINSSGTPDNGETIRATTGSNGNLSATKTLVEYGPAAHLALTLTPSSIPADGTTASTAKATVTDNIGNPVPGETVTITTNGGASIGSVTDNGDGTYTATITSTKADTETIKAAAAGGSKPSDSRPLTVTPGPASSLALSLTPSSIPADGTTASTAKATVTDAHQNPVPGETVTITTDGGASVGSVTDNGDGTYTASITSTKADTETIKAAAAGGSKPSDTKTLTVTPGPAFSLALTLTPSSIPADGTTASTAKATVTDAHGNPVPGETVTITTNGGASVGSVTDNGDGTYTASITSTKADTETIKAAAAGGSKPTDTKMLTVTVVGPVYHAITPARILDTRNNPASPLGPQETRAITVTGGSVPTTHVSAVVINVTATQGSASSFFTLWPAGVAKPLASNLNFSAGENIPNLVVVKVGTSGQVNIYNDQGSAHVIFDVVGYYDDGTVGGGSSYNAVTPARILDTRNSPASPLGPGETRAVTVTGGSVPANASAVVINVTATQGSASSFFTVWPAGVAKPLASNLNFSAGENIPNLVVVKVGTSGQVNIYNDQGSAHAIFDVVGWYDSSLTSGSSYNAVTPARILDTRNSPASPLGPGETRAVTVTGGSVPANASAVVINVTATQGSASSFFTVWPAGVAKPLASNLNFTAGENIPNLVVVKVGTSGQVNIYNDQGSAHAIFDVVGYFGP